MLNTNIRKYSYVLMNYDYLIVHSHVSFEPDSPVAMTWGLKQAGMHSFVSISQSKERPSRIRQVVDECGCTWLLIFGVCE